MTFLPGVDLTQTPAGLCLDEASNNASQRTKRKSDYGGITHLKVTWSALESIRSQIQS